MKLVGATRSFIRAPFLVQSAFQGLFASFIAIIILVGLMFLMRSEFAQLFEIFRMDLLLIVIGIVIVSGLVICLVSTYFVVNKLISLRKDELYY
jgi:cell division transport system permease protein